MIQKTKGVTAFAVIFIIWSIITFIKGVSSLLSLIIYTFLLKSKDTDNVFGYLFGSSGGSPTALNWAISSIGILAGVVLFLAGFFIIKNKISALMLVKNSAIVFIFNNILKIFEEYRRIVIASEDKYGSTTLYFSSLYIAFDIFAILFWVFIIWFFIRKSSSKS